MSRSSLFQFPRRVATNVWRPIKDFSGLGGDATYLWPRWIVLRGVGIVYILIFAGIIDDGLVLIGPHGIAPLSVFFGAIRQLFPNPIEAFFRAPSLFWIGTGAGMIMALAWIGLAAAVALVLNLWPRMALFGCWLIFLSFLATGHFFSATQIDSLMVESALLCIPLAPAGFRPGLGEDSPPRTIAVFMARWLAFRVMLEPGLAKIIIGDPIWRHLTAMDFMYETTPFPTFLGYLDHQLPHAYHAGEAIFTMVAEILAPLLAMFAGRRGRWAAFLIWSAFQTGIELTNNFGWINLGGFVLGILVLDDQMLAAAATRFGLRRLARIFTPRAEAPPALAPWRLGALRGALWVHFGLTLFFFGAACGMTANDFPSFIFRPAAFLFNDFHSSNAFTLFESLPLQRYELEFEGSNDGGETSRVYEFRYQPQQVDKIHSLIAPWYSRFEATLEITLISTPRAALFPAIASHLLVGDPAVIGLFRNNPFPGRPPTMIRMKIYRLTFTDLATYHRTGRIWNKEYMGDYLPMMYVDDRGRVMGGK